MACEVEDEEMETDVPASRTLYVHNLAERPRKSGASRGHAVIVLTLPASREQS
jgi:hypothetical protein